jgi:hypothetical protein
MAEGQSGGISKTIVEVYVETDSESEPYSSSEGDDGSETTLTAQEGATEEEPDLNREPSHKEARVIPSEIVPSQLSPPAIIASSGTSIFLQKLNFLCRFVIMYLQVLLQGNPPFPDSWIRRVDLTSMTLRVLSWQSHLQTWSQMRWKWTWKLKQMTFSAVITCL